MGNYTQRTRLIASVDGYKVITSITFDDLNDAVAEYTRISGEAPTVNHLAIDVLADIKGSVR